MEPHIVRVIANPMAGTDEPFFGPLAAAFGDADIRWNVDVTNGPGEEAELARRAIEEGAQVVVAFGGDGTVSAVAEALVGTDAVLGILPGGTANVFAREVGVPLALDAAAKLLAGPHEIREVDLGVAELESGESRPFTLRVACGLEATIVEESPREEKERLGELAYVLSALRQLPNAPVAQYRIEADSGESIEAQGLFAALTNARNLGIGDVGYPSDVRIDDGVFDGFIAPAAVTDLVGAAAAVVTGSEEPPIPRIAGAELCLTADPPQRVSVDGEIVGDTPVKVRVRPHAVRVIAPPSGSGESER